MSCVWFLSNILEFISFPEATMTLGSSHVIWTKNTALTSSGKVKNFYLHIYTYALLRFVSLQHGSRSTDESYQVTTVDHEAN